MSVAFLGMGVFRRIDSKQQSVASDISIESEILALITHGFSMEPLASSVSVGSGLFTGHAAW
jgi:hypothetical protein